MSFKNESKYKQLRVDNDIIKGVVSRFINIIKNKYKSNYLSYS